MALLPPGTLLQLMYLKERLLPLKPGRFVEIGPGAGHVSALLLSMGWVGEGYDVEPSTITALETRFQSEAASGRYKVVLGDWLGVEQQQTFDLVLSSMVMEHFDADREGQFVAHARACLNQDGHMISLVPGSPDHWGIEDEIAGHFRRYTQRSASNLLEQNGFSVTHTAGLTFPLSNFLLPLSNFLVRRSESRKLALSMEDRTKQSGIRDVPLKTTFPPIAGILLNRWTMWPLHIVQKIFRRSPRALVLYIEASPSVR